MRDFFELFINPRFWSAYIGIFFPIIGCLIAGSYLVVKEKINEQIQIIKGRRDRMSNRTN